MIESTLGIVGIIGGVLAIAFGLSEWGKRKGDQRDDRERKILAHAEAHASLDKRLALVEQSHIDLSEAVGDVRGSVQRLEADMKLVLRSLNGSLRPKD